MSLSHWEEGRKEEMKGGREERREKGRLEGRNEGRKTNEEREEETESCSSLGVPSHSTKIQHKNYFLELA